MNRTTTAPPPPMMVLPTLPPSNGSQPYLAVAIALPVTLAAIAVAMGLLRWKMSKVNKRRNSSYIDRRCLKNSKAPPAYADAQQLSCGSALPVVVIHRPAAGDRLSVTLPRLLRPPAGHRLPTDANIDGGGGSLFASSSLPCISCPDEHGQPTRATPAGDAASDELQTSKPIDASAAAGDVATSRCEPERQQRIGLSAGLRRSGETSDDEEAAHASCFMVGGNDEPDDVSDYSGRVGSGEYAASADGATQQIGAFFAVCQSLPEFAVATEIESASEGSSSDDAGGGGSVHIGYADGRRNSAGAVRTPLGLAFRSVPLFLDDQEHIA